VTPSDAAPGAKPSLVDLLGPLAEYRVFLIGELDGLVAGTAQLADAIKAGDLPAAQALYAPTRAHYERIEPIGKLFSDLDAAIAVRAADLPERETDAGFTGFHRLEYLLFARKALDGAGPVANGLVADVRDLAGRIKALTLPPERIAAAAGALLEGAGALKLQGTEDLYSGTDLSDFRANIDGARKIVDLLHPLSEKADAALAARIDAGFAGVDAVIAKYALPDGGMQAYAALTDADRAALEAPVATLAQDVAMLRGALGLD
jgi:iron uptake system component EfeO